MDSSDGEPLLLELENFACDLLALAKNQPALQRLLRVKKGTWVPVQDLCSEVPGLLKPFQAIRTQSENELMATWLDDPSAKSRDGYVLVLFFFEDLLWSKAAIFKRQSLPRSTSRKPKQAKVSR